MRFKASESPEVMTHLTQLAAQVAPLAVLPTEMPTALLDKLQPLQVYALPHKWLALLHLRCWYPDLGLQHAGETIG